MLYWKPSAEAKFSLHAQFKSWRIAIFSVVGLTVCWLVVSHSLVAYLSTSSPEVALGIRANDARSLSRSVEDELHTIGEDKTKTSDQPALSSSEIIELRQKAETALANDPLSARDYRLLGQIAETEGSISKAEKFMYTAVKRSLNERIAVDWMMRRSVEGKNHRAAIYYADVLLRSTPRLTAYVTPILARMAEDRDAKGEVKKLLATNPNWRHAFFTQLGASLTDARTPLDLFSGLKDSAAPPTADELNSYGHFLFNHKLYDLAYYVWLQFLPLDKLESAGFLFNGDFENAPSGSPFDWRVSPSVNAVVDFASRPENAADRALVVELGPGRVEFRGVLQTILLPSGAYAFKGAFKGEIRGPRGVLWSARCLGGATLGQSEIILGSFPDWRVFEFSLVVPNKGCPAQMVELKLAARSPSEKLVSGIIWFDELSIARTRNNPKR
jgi:hypothetical protein